MEKSDDSSKTPQGVINYTRTGRISKAEKSVRVHYCECGKSYTRLEHLRRHKKNHAQNELICGFPDCGKIFYRRDLLQRHQERHNESLEPHPESIAEPSTLPRMSTIKDLQQQANSVGDASSTGSSWSDPFSQSPDYGSSSGYSLPPGDFLKMVANPPYGNSPYGTGKFRARTPSDASFIEPSWSYPSRSPTSGESLLSIDWSDNRYRAPLATPYNTTAPDVKEDGNIDFWTPNQVDDTDVIALENQLTGHGYLSSAYSVKNKEKAIDRSSDVGQYMTTRTSRGIKIHERLSDYQHKLMLLGENTGQGQTPAEESAKSTHQFEVDPKTPAHQNLSDLAVSVHSDSGSQSGLGEDSVSVCSANSTGSSLGLPQDFLHEFLAFFGDSLIEKAGARRWIAHAHVHLSNIDIEKRLNTLLKVFTQELVVPQAEPSSWETRKTSSAAQNLKLIKATKLIGRHRSNIISYFQSNAASSAASADSLEGPLTELDQQGSLSERLALLEKSAANNSHLNNEGPSEEEMELELLEDLGVVRDVMVSSSAFDSLAVGLRRALYYDEGLEMRNLQVHMKQQLPRDIICFNVDLPLENFMRTQYGDNIPSIGSVVITGSSLYAQATTCSEYMKQNWPNSGQYLVECLDSILAKTDKTKFAYLGMTMEITSIESGTLMIIVEGAKENILTEIAQQLAWLGSALNSSPFGDDLAYCYPVLSGYKNPLDVAISFGYKALHDTEISCWWPLFSGAVIASGFPIPAREDGAGLEIPLDLLAGIAGICHAVVYDGGVVMKGFSHMFVPIRKTNDTIQWHAVLSRRPDKRLTYPEGLSLCGDRALQKDVNLHDLSRCRAIVGWCSIASSRLGSQSVNYGNIDYSGAEDISSSLRCSGGSLGFQQFATASLDFKFGVKDGKCHFQRSGPYRSIVSAAEETHVLLYDTGEKRAWLVPASSVMLHVIQHRHYLEPFEVDGKKINLATGVAVGSTAKQVLMANENLRVSDSDNYTFKESVLGVWSLLEFLIDQNVAREKTSPGAPIKASLRENLQGFEFKAVVKEKSPFRLKHTSLERSTRGWPQLVRDTDALVLLANGFEDLIVPAEDENPNLCKSWMRVPKARDYMAASTSCMKDLYDVAGCRLTRDYLTSTRLRWHQGDSIVFEGCQEPQKKFCCCDRLQRVCSKSSPSKIVKPHHIVDTGAIIFGQPSSLRGNIIEKLQGSTSDKQGLYSQSNRPIMENITSQNINESSFSDSDTCPPSGSDGTIESSISSLTTHTTDSFHDRNFGEENSLSGSTLSGATLVVNPKKRSRFLDFSSLFGCKEDDEFSLSRPEIKRARGL